MACYRELKRSALRRTKSLTLSIDEYKELVVGRACFYCEHRPAEGQGLLGLDRVDNTRGYHARNCVASCARCNYMKGSLGVREFTTQCATIAARTNVTAPAPAPIPEYRWTVQWVQCPGKWYRRMWVRLA